MNPEPLPGINPPVRMLSLWEPWATSLARPDLPKTRETRGYSTPYRGPVIICAAVHRLTKAERAALPPEVADFYLTNRPTRTMPPIPLGFGHALAVGELDDVVPTRTIDDPDAWGDYGPGRYAWIFSTMRLLDDPIPVKGGQGPRPAPEWLVDACGIRP